MGDDEGLGDRDQTPCRSAITEMGKDYVVNEGDGAFYGPKLDFHLADSHGPYLAVRHHPAGLSSCPSVSSLSTPAQTARSTVRL